MSRARTLALAMRLGLKPQAGSFRSKERLLPQPSPAGRYSPAWGFNPRALALACSLLLLAGCRQNMHNQNKVEPLEGHTFFEDGKGSRPLPAGTVPRGGPGEKIAPYTGLTVSRREVPPGPPQVTMAMLRRGQERFNVFCSPCHDRTGNGLGMIVRRGYKQPTSFHDPRLRGAPADYFVQVITEGFGVMPPYASQVPVEDRWAIAAYIRALQYSQNARLADLPAGRRQEIEQTLAGAPSGRQGQQGVTRPGSAEEYDRRPDPTEVP